MTINPIFSEDSWKWIKFIFEYPFISYQWLYKGINLQIIRC